MLVIQKKKSLVDNALEWVADENTVNFWLKKFNPVWSLHDPLAKITKKENPAPDMVSLTLKVNRHFQFGTAGQHHPVYVNVNGVRFERSYSLTRIDATHVQLNAKKVTGGKVSTWLFEQAKLGDVLEFGQPYGDMTIAELKQPYVLLAAGSGITPMLSLLNELVQSKRLESQPVQLMYWVKTKEDAAFADTFEKIAQQFKNFRYQIFYTQEQDQRFNETHLEAFLPLNNHVVYACGPSGFVQHVEKLCRAAALVKTEAFSLSEIEHSDIGFVNVTLTQSNKVLTIPKGQSILSSLEQQNIKPNHGCRMGICNKCACNKVEGSTRNMVNGMQNHEPGNLLKICVNSAQTDLVIDL